MATLAGLVEATYNRLYGMGQFERPIEDTQVTSTINAAATEVEFTTPNLWKRGDYAEYDDGEVVYLTEDHPTAGSTATIRRAQRGSTAATHAASSAFVYKNPLFPRVEIERTINEVVRLDLWPELFTWHKDSVTWVAGDHLYDLDQYVEDVVTVYQYNIDGDGKMWPLDRNWWDVERQVDSGLATNGALLRLRKTHNVDYTTYYTAKRRPHVDDLANLSDEIADLIPWAAAGKLTATMRTTPARYDPARQRRENSEGGPFRDYRGFMAEFLRMKDAHARLLKKEVHAEVKWRPAARRRTF